MPQMQADLADVSEQITDPVDLSTVGSYYRPIRNYQLDAKGEEVIILYTHMHFITNKFHLYHSDYILQEL